MSVKEDLEVLLKEINERIRKDKSLRKILELYCGKRLILNIEGDICYSFKIELEGIILEIVKEYSWKPSEMYMKMGKDIVKKIIDRRKVRLSDLRFIEHRNIKIQDVKTIRDIRLQY